MVRAVGLQPTTSDVVGRCSMPLSYARTIKSQRTSLLNHVLGTAFFINHRNWLVSGFRFLWHSRQRSFPSIHRLAIRTPNANPFAAVLHTFAHSLHPPNTFRSVL